MVQHKYGENAHIVNHGAGIADHDVPERMVWICLCVQQVISSLLVAESIVVGLCTIYDNRGHRLGINDKDLWTFDGISRHSTSYVPHLILPWHQHKCA